MSGAGSVVEMKEERKNIGVGGKEEESYVDAIPYLPSVIPSRGVRKQVGEC